MFFLSLTTLLWAFSFSLIGVYLAGQVDTWFAVFMRIALAFVLFIPFLKRANMPWRVIPLFMTVGAVQLGVMYLFYYQSFLYLTVAEILLFTIMTPIYVSVIYDLLKGQRIRVSYLLSAGLAVIGAAIIRYDQLSSDFWFGLLMVQGANLSFALGQVGYKRLIELYPMPQHNAFAWFYLGALIIATLGFISFGNVEQLPTTSLQWGILLWLGLGASGCGYFMWNYGATQVDAGTLAIMNNVLIPVGLLVNFLLWQENVDWVRLISGGGVILLSLYVHRFFIAKSLPQ